MPKVKIGSEHGQGGSSPGHRVGNEGTTNEILAAIRGELDDLRTKYLALLTYLDGSTDITPQDHVATYGLAESTFEK